MRMRYDDLLGQPGSVTDHSRPHTRRGGATGATSLARAAFAEMVPLLNEAERVDLLVGLSQNTESGLRAALKLYGQRMSAPVRGLINKAINAEARRRR